MAGEWIGVAGVAIGSGMTGVLALRASRMQASNERDARREAAELAERYRAEDRDRTLRQQNVERRRDEYTTLLDAATNVLWSLVSYATNVPVAGEPGRLAFLGIYEVLEPFQQALHRVELLAVDPAVRRVGDELRSEATDLYHRIQFSRLHEGRSNVRLEEVDEAMTAIVGRLRSACRSDLGFADATEPPSPGA